VRNGVYRFALAQRQVESQQVWIVGRVSPRMCTLPVQGCALVHALVYYSVRSFFLGVGGLGWGVQSSFYKVLVAGMGGYF